jgi:hypothetical protein
MTNDNPCYTRDIKASHITWAKHRWATNIEWFRTRGQRFAHVVKFLENVLENFERFEKMNMVDQVYRLMRSVDEQVSDKINACFAYL